MLRNHPEKLPLILFWYDVCDFYNNKSYGFDKVGMNTGFKLTFKQLFKFKKHPEIKT